MPAKFHRRHLFARLGAGLAALWACLRRTPPAAAKAAAVPRPLPPTPWSGPSDGCGGATCVASTYDGQGRLVSQRVCTDHHRLPVLCCSEAGGTVTVTYAAAADPTPPDAPS
jgi:hypothetical protein